MAKRAVSETQTFGLGLKNFFSEQATLSLPTIPRNASHVLTNFRVNNAGVLQARYGSQQLTSADIGISSPFRGTYWEHAGLHVYVDSGANKVGTFSAETPIVTPTLSSAMAGAAFVLGANHVDFAPFRDAVGEQLYIATAMTGAFVAKFDGTSLVGINGPYNFTSGLPTLAVYNQRLFAARTSAGNSFLVWSELNDGDTLGDTALGGGLAQITTMGRSDIYGLLTVGGSLFIFHQNAISRFTGWAQDDVQIDTGTTGVSTTLGTRHPYACVSLGHAGFFFDESGFYRITETSLQSISEDLDTSALKGLTPGELYGVYNEAKREIWWMARNDTTVYVYNTDTGVWTTFSYQFNATHSMYSIWASPTAVLCALNTNSGADDILNMEIEGIFKDHVSETGTGGNTITFSAQKRFFFENPNTEKALRFGYIHGSNLSGAVFTSGSVSGDIGSADPISVTATGTTRRFHCSPRGRIFTYSLAANYDTAGTPAQFYVSAVGLEGFEYGPRFA